MKPRREGGELARALSKLGYCSRTQAAALIEAGRVQVNGVVRRDPHGQTDLEHDELAVDGRPVSGAAKVYLMLNKPRGLVTTAADEKGRKTVFECLAGKDLPFVAPVGRLDKASEGLLLFTNDSAWAARLAAPASHVDRLYHVQVDRVADEALVRRIEAGVREGGEALAAKGASVLRRGDKTSWLAIVLDEGKNRHIRRLLGALDVHVLRLVRVAIGPLVLGSLARGQVRHLTAQERDSLAVAQTPRTAPRWPSRR